MKPTVTARRLRREQTQEEKQLWRALRAGRFDGFKFRRQHPLGKYYLDFYCPIARLSVELDGFQHGLPRQRIRDAAREQFLTVEGIEELRFWNHQWRKNREGVLLKIWEALHRRTGCVQILRKVQNNRYVPPDTGRLIVKPPLPDATAVEMEHGDARQAISLSPRGTSGERVGERGNPIKPSSSPRASPPPASEEREKN